MCYCHFTQLGQERLCNTGWLVLDDNHQCALSFFVSPVSQTLCTPGCTRVCLCDRPAWSVVYAFKFACNLHVGTCVRGLALKDCCTFLLRHLPAQFFLFADCQSSEGRTQLLLTLTSHISSTLYCPCGNKHQTPHGEETQQWIMDMYHT